MREIEFRGKLLNSNEWIYGGLIQRDGRAYIVGISKRGMIDGLEVDPETVGQYTGLSDKIGRKIFEGDIVHNDYGYPGVVEWLYGSFIIRFFNGDDWDICQYIKEECIKIIGNIHDNPELLEVDKCE